MSTTKKPLKYLWLAIFNDGHIIRQPEDDRYSKHDDNAEWNPSSFRDILEYPSELSSFWLLNARRAVVGAVFIEDGIIYLNGIKTSQNVSTGPRKLIYYRNVEQNYIDGAAQDPEVVEYCFGYEYKNKQGKNVQRIVTLDGNN